jgi:hypothetical protein
VSINELGMSANLVCLGGVFGFDKHKRGISLSTLILNGKVVQMFPQATKKAA